jgi:hypothetical protein
MWAYKSELTSSRPWPSTLKAKQGGSFRSEHSGSNKPTQTEGSSHVAEAAIPGVQGGTFGTVSLWT